MARIVHHDADEVLEQLRANGKATLVLSRKETAWDPSSTRRIIVGPGKVEYVQYPDGGINATISVD